ncbi:hypothetical protein J4219_01165 [Candidatus Woesearchaeota archaeon]|nr:hypothetical protein [Candidatus Woesearchaeota archaeon]
MNTHERKLLDTLAMLTTVFSLSSAGSMYSVTSERSITSQSQQQPPTNCHPAKNSVIWLFSIRTILVPLQRLLEKS